MGACLKDLCALLPVVKQVTDRIMQAMVDIEYILKISFQQKQDVKEWYTLKGIKIGEIQMSVIVNLPEKVFIYRMPDELESTAF